MAAPSLSHLASILSRSGTVRPPPAPRVAIARPEPALRVGMVATLGLLISVGAGTTALAWGFHQLVGSVRELRAERRFQEREAVPAPEVLLDRSAFQRERSQRPLAAPVLLTARLDALAGKGLWSEVLAEIAEAELSRPLDITPRARLRQAEARLRTGDVAGAGGILHAIDAAGLDEAGRARAAELAGLVWLSPPDGGRSR